MNNILQITNNKYMNLKEEIKMEEKQKINCTVCSCEHNQPDNKCDLKEITVSPVMNKNTEQPDESMCSSYKVNCE